MECMGASGGNTLAHASRATPPSLQPYPRTIYHHSWTLPLLRTWYLVLLYKIHMKGHQCEPRHKPPCRDLGGVSCRGRSRPTREFRTTKHRGPAQEQVPRSNGEGLPIRIIGFLPTCSSQRHPETFHGFFFVSLISHTLTAPIKVQ